MKKVFLLLLMSFNIGTAQTNDVLYAQQTKEKFTAEVIKITDGDTFKVRTEDGVKYTIRLAGVDAPEKKQEYGIEAKEFVAKELYLDGEFQVTVQIVGKDFFGRYVAWIYYGTETTYNLSEVLLKNGYAWHFKEYDSNDYLQKLEDIARENKVGLWQADNPVYPSEFRKSKKRR